MSRKRNDRLNKSIAIFYIVDGMNAHQIYRLLAKEAKALVGDEPVSLPTVQRRSKWFEANREELEQYFSDKLPVEQMNGVRRRFHF